jgi:hypothetical protein
MPSEGDDYEPDDTCAAASAIATDGTVQEHTFHAAGDVDWAAFTALSGTTYLIEVQPPAVSTADVILELYAGCGGLPEEATDPSFSPGVRLQFVAPHSGTYYLRLNDHDPEAGGEDVSYALSVRSLSDTPSPGALVLVAGRLEAGDPLQRNIHHVTNTAYRLFQTHGYDAERIYYLASDLSLDADGDSLPDVDVQANPSHLEQAITQWAVDKVGPERALTLYLMDHGGYDRFYLNGRSETVTPEELDTWLETLEAAVPGVPVNVIIEACHAGSFVDLAQSVSQPGRVVVVSTGAYALAYASADGAVFSDSFLDALGLGQSLYGSFAEARWAVQEGHPQQTPWLDDNGNGIPNEVGDGAVAQVRGFNYAGTFAEVLWPPYVREAHVRDVHAGGGVIAAEIHDDVGVLSAWAVIYPPSYTPPAPEGVEEMVQEDLETAMLLDTNGDQIFTAYSSAFDEVGEYRVVIYALDGDGLQGRPRSVTVRTGWQVYLPLVVRR